MHILIGIPASGKSSFADSELPHCVHISKDNMNGTKKDTKQRRMIHEAISAGKSVVVDNTNTTVELRAKLIRQARELGATVHGHYFKSNLKECLTRNALRSGIKPSGKDAKVPERVMRSFFNSMQTPRWDEGFDVLNFVTLGSQQGSFNSTPMRKTCGAQCHCIKCKPLAGGWKKPGKTTKKRKRDEAGPL